MLLCVKFRAFFAHNLATFYIQKCHTNTPRAFYGINMAHFLPIFWHKNAPQHHGTHTKPETSPKSGHFLPILLPLLSRIYTAETLPASCCAAFPCKCTKQHQCTNVVTCRAHFVQNDARKASIYAGSVKVVTKCTKWTQKTRSFSLRLFINFGAYISTILRNTIRTRQNLDADEKERKRGRRCRSQHSWQPPLMQCSAQRADARDRNKMVQNHFCKWFYFYF